MELETKACTLKGTLVTQDDLSKATTLVILIAGSGPTDRNGNNPQAENNSLKYVSDCIVDAGHACLRYDKRGIAESTLTEIEAGTVNFDSFISDAVAWVDKYAADVRFNNIVLAGHSQGSLVALCAANQNENVKGVISISGAGQPIHEILKWQLSRTLSIEMQGLVNAKLDTLASGNNIIVVPNGLESLMHPSIQPFLISWMKYDPAKEAANLKVPLLIVNGTTDLQIRVNEDAKVLKEAQPEADLVIIKNMNHTLKLAKTKDIGLQMEYYTNPDYPLHKKLPKAILKYLAAL